ncbi:MAG: hypothetical protein H0U18_02280 [Pyrinomonadaceae bacterium]|nr:hypothetical protein [Pyrinomonadaceae bacterium]
MLNEPSLLLLSSQESSGPPEADSSPAISSLIVLILSIVVVGKGSRPYRNGSVWQISFIQMKPRMDTAYLNYIATGDWKREQEALKKDGQIISYKVLTTEGHSSTDWNIMLMTEYKDMATMEANETKADNLAQTVTGNDEKQMQGGVCNS